LQPQTRARPRAGFPSKKRLGVFLVGGIGGGIASQGVPAIVATTRGLADAFDVTVYSLTRPDPGFRAQGYTVCSPPAWLDALDAPSRRKLRWPLLAARFLAEHRRCGHAAVLSFWGYPMGVLAVGLAHLVRRPSVVTIMGAEAASVPTIGYGQLRRPHTRKLVLETCRRASKVVLLSEYQRKNLHQFGLRRNDLEIIPFGSDVEKFKLRAKAREPPLKILHVANLTEVKDQATLVRGFALLRRDMDAKLRIVGPDYLAGNIHKLVADLGLHEDVEFVGPLAHASIPLQYDWADLFVLTSLSEGQCTALTDAAMSGVLQVSTAVGCAADQGEDAVVVVRPGDPGDLAAKIRAIASDPVEWQRKTVRARAWAEAHDLRWTIARFTDVIDRAISCSSVS
jgi:glycosyltransferase involved in cell wall biosynthesis